MSPYSKYGQYCGLLASLAPHAQSCLTVDKKSSCSREQLEQASSNHQTEAQSRQTEVPGYEYSPVGQAVQLCAPSKEMVPAGHMEVVEDPLGQ